MSSPSSSSLAPTRSWTYEVFLSFKGEDTGHTFVDHLYTSLVQKGIHAFKDNRPISQDQLMRVIEESRFAVVILSKNYANSTWCLEELTKIMECQDQMGLKVLPVFYHVDPSHVRKQKRDFETAFEQHEENFEGVKDLNKWREALTAVSNLSGLHIFEESGGESAHIDKIVNEILHNIQPDCWDSNLIGIDSRVDALNSLLNIDATQEVRMIWIYGNKGIGKTTIAQTLFRRIAYKFEGSSFINNVRENSSTTEDICSLQEKIVKDILVVQQGLMIQHPDHGAEMIQNKFRNKRVLLVLDDVNDLSQLEYLAAEHEWFGPGSRIIITTRDEDLLSGVEYKYKPTVLLKEQAVELFSRHAFRKNSPPDEFKSLSDRAICLTGGVPLDLKVLGSFFNGRKKISVWESALARLDKPNSEVSNTLKLSFDHLDGL